MERAENMKRVKRIAVILVCLMFLLTTASAFAVPADGFSADGYAVEAFNNEDKIVFTNKPFIEDEVVYIPLRETLNICGVPNGDIVWENGRVNIQILPTKAEVSIGNSDCYINDMAVFLTGETRLKNNTAYISSDFINALDLCLADLGGDKIFGGFRIIHNGADVIAEYFKTGFSPDDILIIPDGLPKDMADAYKNKIFTLYGLNSAYSEYFLYDTDNDGVMELFIGWRDMRVYTYTDGLVKMLGHVYNEVYKLEGEAGIYTYGGFGTGVGGTLYYEKLGDVLVPKEGKISLNYTAFADDVKYLYNDVIISEEEYNSIVEQYFNDSNIASTRQNVGDYLKSAR